MPDIHKYDNIINLPHHQSAVRPHMSLSDRAAQFAPFATLSGHGDAILETERLTDQWKDLTEEEARSLNMQTEALRERIAAGEKPQVRITYFRPDEKKDGGSYEVCAGSLRRIDEACGRFIFSDGRMISAQDITEILEVDINLK